MNLGHFKKETGCLGYIRSLDHFLGGIWDSTASLDSGLFLQQIVLLFSLSGIRRNDEKPRGRSCGQVNLPDITNKEVNKWAHFQNSVHFRIVAKRLSILTIGQKFYWASTPSVSHLLTEMGPSSTLPGLAAPACPTAERTTPCHPCWHCRPDPSISSPPDLPFLPYVPSSLRLLRLQSLTITVTLVLSHCLSQPPIVWPGPPYCAPLPSQPGRLLGPSPLSATPVTALHICKPPVAFRRVPALQPALKPLRNLLLTCLSSLTCPPSATPVDLLFATRPVQLSLCVRVSPHHAYVTPPHPHLFTSYSSSKDEATCCFFLEDRFDYSRKKCPLLP